MRQRFPLVLAASLLVPWALLVPLPALGDPDGGGRVTFRARLGNDVEAMTSLGPNAVAVLDGYDVVAIPIPRNEPGTRVATRTTKLFDVRRLPTGALVPRGFAYDPGRERFYFGPGATGANPIILVTDREGHEKPSIPLKLLPGQVSPVQFESLAYIPPAIPRIGDRIAAVLIGEDQVGRISIVRLDGTVEYEIPVTPGSPAENYVTGMAFLPPDRFLFAPLVGTDAVVYQVDLAGSVTGPVLADDPGHDLEGIAALSGGRIAVTDYTRGEVLVFDARGARLAHQDRDFTIGRGISNPTSLAWDARANRILVSAASGGDLARRNVFASSPPFTAATQVTHTESTEMVSPQGIAALPDTDEIAFCDQAGLSETRGVWIFGAGTGEFRARLSLLPFPAGDFRPVRVTPLPGGLLALRVNQRPSLVQVVTRDGVPDPSDPTVRVPALVGTISLSVPAPVRSGLDFDAATGLLLVGRQYYDLAGAAAATLGTVPPDFLGQEFVRITTGPFAGQIAGLDPTASELVIFRP